MAKLTKAKADEIRWKSAHTHNPRELAKMYGVSPRLIHKILANTVWVDPDYTPYGRSVCPWLAIAGSDQQIASGASDDDFAGCDSPVESIVAKEELVKNASNQETASIHAIDENLSNSKGEC